MSSAPDQNSAAQAMLQAGSAMARGASESLSPQQKNEPVAPGGLDLSAWDAGSKELFALQQEWMERQAQVWFGLLDKAAAKPDPQVANPAADNRAVDQPASAKPPMPDPQVAKPAAASKKKLIAKKLKSVDPQVAKPAGDNKPVEKPASAKPPIIDYLRESALVNVESLKREADVVVPVPEVAPVPQPTKDQVRHVTREVVDAMAPSRLFASRAETTTSNYQEIRDELKSGDIIVASKGNMQSFNGFISLFVRIVTASSYSHVGVVVKLGNRCFVVEATPPVVRLYPLSKLDSFYVIKMDQALSREDENRLFEYVGMPYSDWNSIVTYFTGKPLANGKLQCAQLVSSFYNWPNLLRPEQIVRYTQEMLGKRMVFVP